MMEKDIKSYQEKILELKNQIAIQDNMQQLRNTETFRLYYLQNQEKLLTKIDTLTETLNKIGQVLVNIGKGKGITPQLKERASEEEEEIDEDMEIYEEDEDDEEYEEPEIKPKKKSRDDKIKDIEKSLSKRKII